jgi:hypothetical protein
LAIVAMVVPFAGPSGASASSGDGRPRLGPGIAADNLNNSIVGGPRGQRVAYRFRATATARLRAINIYVINGKSGYSRGSGGRLRITLRADDGTAQHHPGRRVLARRILERPPFRAGVEVRFPTAPWLVRGRLYHVVFDNVHPRPARNYASVNGLFVYREQPRWQPAFPNLHWAQLLRVPGRDWSVERGRGRGTITPIMTLKYANGMRGGVGYMEVWYREPKMISGQHRVRQVFRVGGRSRVVSSASVRLKRINGDGPLHFTLRAADGRVVASGRVEASRVARAAAGHPGGSTWATARFGRPIRLHVGHEYGLELSTDTSTRYSIFAVRQGSTYGYGGRSIFANGHAEYRDGGRWKLFTGWGRPSREGDLQFYFR